MEWWELKMPPPPPWSSPAAGFDGEDDPDPSPRGSTAVPDCSVDLKLGGLGGFAGGGDKEAAMAPPATKRARAAGDGRAQRACCAVDGCKADLSKCREYHRRHKVCESHSKTPVVLICGREQRFCQQCSRFHSLTEFDEVKRSCRKRLDSHNRRRRKPLPESNNSGVMYLNHQGSRYWTPVLSVNEDAFYARDRPLHPIERQQTMPSFGIYNAEKRLPFSQDLSCVPGTGAPLEASSNFPPHRKPSAPSGNSTGSLFSSDGFSGVLGSGRALSLLSMPARASVIESNSNVVSALHAVVPCLEEVGEQLGQHSCSLASNSVSSTGFSSSATEGGRAAAVFASDAHDPELHLADLFQIGVDGSADEASHALPFAWQC